jgi:glucose-1-phosphate thymidylyltransferase
VVDIVEKAGVVDKRYPAPPTNEAVVGLYCFPPDVFDVISRLEPSSRGELEITDVNRHYAQQGRLDVVRVEGWWEDAGKHWQHLAEIGRRVDETGANR